MIFTGLLVLGFGFVLMTVASVPAVSRQVRGGALRRGRKSAYVTRDLTAGSVPRNLVFLAWPMIGSSSFRVVEMLADLFWAGLGFGTAAIAGVGTAQMWVQIIMGSRRGLDIAVRAMVSRAVGATNLPLANHVALQGLTFSAAVSWAIALIGILLTPQLMGLVGVGDDVVAEATMYMRIQFVALAIAAMTQICLAIFQASGDSLTPFRIPVQPRFPPGPQSSAHLWLGHTGFQRNGHSRRGRLQRPDRSFGSLLFDLHFVRRQVSHAPHLQRVHHRLTYNLAHGKTRPARLGQQPGADPG